MKNPLVSIIIPCYNQADYLADALESVKNQTYNDWECIIINDGSPDDTQKVASFYLMNDNRFRYFFQKNKGVSNARNNGIKLSRGDFILPLDADDVIDSNYLRAAVECFENDNKLKIVYCKAEKFGIETGPLILPEFSLPNLGKKNMIFCTALFRKSDSEKIGGYDENMKEGLEDWDHWIGILKNGGKVKRLNFVGFYYRIKENSRNKNMNPYERRKLVKYLSIKHADFFVNLYGPFTEIADREKYLKKEFLEILKSKKVVLDIFFKTFFGFMPFGGGYLNKQK
ncbi:glycosyltransferase family 2 protein [Salegentibacter sp. UBA1130]|uniref:glycosyltransferase family 2 protein n=1 Tax=Salegentibacter sp. UBA1130 TaxID=1947451 RepID=UPI00257EBA9F|nr:glycosyltransferase family A protein [Salegentibacter sp. UBA1130]